MGNYLIIAENDKAGADWIKGKSIKQSLCVIVSSVEFLSYIDLSEFRVICIPGWRKNPEFEAIKKLIVNESGGGYEDIEGSKHEYSIPPEDLEAEKKPKAVSQNQENISKLLAIINKLERRILILQTAIFIFGDENESAKQIYCATQEEGRVIDNEIKGIDWSYLNSGEH